MMFRINSTTFCITVFTSFLLLASANPSFQMDSTTKPQHTKRQTPSQLSAACNIYGGASVAPEVPEISYFVEIILSGSWPTTDGLLPELKSNLGSSNVIRYSYTSTVSGGANVRFYAPAIQGSSVVHWDSQISNSIKSYSGSAGISVTCQYPGI